MALDTSPTVYTGVTSSGVITASAGVVGSVREPVQTLTASGAITITSGTVNLSHASVIIAATLPAPTAGDELVIFDGSASGTAAHTVTVPSGVTFDGTNNTATLNAAGECLHIRALSATRWAIVVNTGAVALSSV